MDTVRVNLRLRGGKGGFGSLLKAQACNIKVMLKFNYWFKNYLKKATNVESSRDLEGRRIRNTANVKELEEFFRKKKKDDENFK